MDPVEELREVKVERDALMILLTAIIEAVGGCEEVTNKQLMLANVEGLVIEQVPDRHCVRVTVE